MLLLINFLKSITCSINSGRNWSIYIFYKFCRQDSSVKGRTKVKHVLFVNDERIEFLILFRT